MAHALSRQQEIAAVHLAIRALTEALRAVTRFFYLDELSQREVCAALDLPLTTAKKRLHDARHPWGVVLDEAMETLDAYRQVQGASPTALVRMHRG